MAGSASPLQSGIPPRGRAGRLRSRARGPTRSSSRLLAIAGLSLATAPAARADWQRVPTPVAPTTDDRRGGARAHAGRAARRLARVHTSGNTRTLSHTASSADDGTVGETSVVTERLARAGRSGARRGGPTVCASFFGGVHTSHPDELNTEINTAVSVDGGRDVGAARRLDHAAGTAGVRPTTLSARRSQADGTPLVAWADEAGILIHRGLDPRHRGTRICRRRSGRAARAPGVAAADGRTVVAWFSARRPPRRLRAGPRPGGALLGTAVADARTTTSLRTGMAARTPVVVRPGGGPTSPIATGSNASRAIILWSVGSARTVTIGRAPRAPRPRPSPPGATAASGSRGPRRSTAAEHVMARRSNPAATTLGRHRRRGPPGRRGDWRSARTAATPTARSTSWRPSPSATRPGLDVLRRACCPGLTMSVRARASPSPTPATRSPASASPPVGAARRRTSTGRRRCRSPRRPRCAGRSRATRTPPRRALVTSASSAASSAGSVTGRRHAKRSHT